MIIYTIFLPSRVIVLHVGLIVPRDSCSVVVPGVVIPGVVLYSYLAHYRSVRN